MNLVYLELTRKYKKSLLRLSKSYNKIIKIDLNAIDFEDDEKLEVLETFVSRFARSADYFLSKVIRARVLLEDPAYRGTLKAHLSELKKINFIENIDEWMIIRELRNRISHEYTEEELPNLIKALLEKTNTLFESESKL